MSTDILRRELREILDTLPSRYDPVLASSISGPCEFRLSGAVDTSFFLVCEPGRVRAVEGRHPAPSSVVTIDAQALVDVCLHRVALEDLVNSRTVDVTGRLEDVTAASWMLFMPPDQLKARFDAIEATWASLPRLAAIPSTEAPSREDLEEAARLHRPLLVKGALRSWTPASWSAAFLGERYGHLPLVSDAREATIATFLEEARTGVAPGASSSSQMPPQMADELSRSFFESLPSPFDRRMWNGIHEFFLSRPNASTGLHRDVSDGVVTALLAPRRILFFAPDLADAVYPYSSVAAGFQLCHVDPRNPDLASYPRFAGARPITMDLWPGDLLFLPGGWFHHVTALDVSIAFKLHFHDHWADHL